mgnify:CR=1 FL=1
MQALRAAMIQPNGVSSIGFTGGKTRWRRVPVIKGQLAGLGTIGMGYLQSPSARTRNGVSGIWYLTLKYGQRGTNWF